MFTLHFFIWPNKIHSNLYTEKCFFWLYFVASIFSKQDIFSKFFCAPFFSKQNILKNGFIKFYIYFFALWKRFFLFTVLGKTTYKEVEEEEEEEE